MCSDFLVSYNVWILSRFTHCGNELWHSTDPKTKEESYFNSLDIEYGIAQTEITSIDFGEVREFIWLVSRLIKTRIVKKQTWFYSVRPQQKTLL